MRVTKRTFLEVGTKAEAFQRDWHYTGQDVFDFLMTAKQYGVKLVDVRIRVDGGLMVELPSDD